MSKTAGASIAPEGILSVELTPPLESSDVIRKLNRTLAAAEGARIAVAYWCADPNVICPLLQDRTSSNGFICVDIHLPTDIDILHRMRSAGANIFLHLSHPNPQPGELKAAMPPHLLHSKVLLFDLPDAQAELWVGSHNWTVRALTGLNIEASLVLRLTRHSRIYIDTIKFLESVRAVCNLFDPSAVSYYKWLQGQAPEEPTWVIEVRATDPSQVSGRKFTVFVVSENQYRNLKSVDRDVVLSVRSLSSDGEVLYDATITDTGRLAGSGVTFGERLYALHSGRAIPVLIGPSIPSPAELKPMGFWATVDVRNSLPHGMATCELPPSERWVPTREHPLETRVEPEFRRLFRNPRKPLVSRPIPTAVFEGRASIEFSELAEHRVTLLPQGVSQAGEHQVVRRMIVRKHE